MTELQEIRKVTSSAGLDTVLRTTNRVVAMVYATWCPFCRRFLPVFENYARGNAGLVLVEDNQEEVAEEYDVEIIPTVLCFEKGRVIHRLDGIPGMGLNEQQLKDFLERIK